MLRRSATVAALALAASLASTSMAYAQLAPGPKCKRVSDTFGKCIITADPPAGSPVIAVQPTLAGHDKPKCTRFPNVAVPCSDPVLGLWLNALGIYCKVAAPQPDATDPVWQGNFGSGAVYDCYGITFPFLSQQLWLPGKPATTISPQEAAQAIVRRMDLRAATIGIVPQDKPGSIGAVGAPVFMWTTPGPTTFGPQVLTASQGGVSITATAKVDRIVWDMGDGSSVTCRTPGTVYQDSFGFGDSPDCGHRYTRTSAGKPNNAYPIAATSYWVVNWTGPAGSAGQITLDLTARTNIAVGELQALVTN